MGRIRNHLQTSKPLGLHNLAIVRKEVGLRDIKVQSVYRKGVMAAVYLLVPVPIKHS